MIGIPGLAQMTEAVSTAFKGTWAQMTELFLIEHDEDGKHTDITAHSIAVASNTDTGATGAVAAESLAVSGPATFRSGITVTDTATAPSNVLTVTQTIIGVNVAKFTAKNGGVFIFRDETTLYGNGDVADLIWDRGATSVRWVMEGTTTKFEWAGASTFLTVDAGATKALALAITGRLAPPQITATVNDYNPTGLSAAGRLILSLDAAHDMTGIAAQSDGRLLWLVNNSGFDLTLKNATTSSAGNQIATPNAADYIIRGNNGTALLIYDATIAFWFVLGA